MISLLFFFFFFQNKIDVAVENSNVNEGNLLKATT